MLQGENICIVSGFIGDEMVEVKNHLPETDEGFSMVTISIPAKELVHAEEAYTIVQRMMGEKLDKPTGLEEMSDQLAAMLYTQYCEKVGGKAFNGDPLPSWTLFEADPAKQVQVNAWKFIAKAAIVFVVGSPSQEFADNMIVEVTQGLGVQVDNDGTWLHFAAEDGSKASLNINSYFHGSGLVENVVRKWGAAIESTVSEQS